MFGLGVPELAIILAILVIIFGASRLPEIGKGIGEAIKNFKRSMTEPPEIDITPDNEKKEEKHVFSLLVENQPGVLSRIAGLFSGRGFNIESLCVAETIDPDISRITLVTIGDMAITEQIKKHLNKLINVIKVADFTDTAFVQREMALIKVSAKPEHRAEILRMVDIFRSRVVDVGAEGDK